MNKCTNRATVDDMEDLHAQTAKTLRDVLAYQWRDEDGRPVPPPAAYITTAINFLKVNGITGLAPTPSNPIDFTDEATKRAFDESLRAVAGIIR